MSRVICSRILRWGLALCFLVSVVMPGRAASIYVDISNQSGIEDGTPAHPFTSIQAGIDSAIIGDTVWVAPGTYYETLNMANGVSVIGADPATTIIDATQRPGAVVFFGGTQNAPRLKNFTITGGTGTVVDFISGVPIIVGGGIVVRNSSPVITNNIITGNVLTEGYVRGGGIYINATSFTPAITGNVISDNVALSADHPEDSRGGGLYVFGKTATILVSENLFENNVSFAGGGMFSYDIQSASIKIHRNQFRDNQAEDGAALKTTDFNLSSSSIVNNVFENNGSMAGVKDCDDNNGMSSPGLTEICNDGIDNDCNPATTDIFDADGDGSMCNVDCDDSDPTIHPGAAENCLDHIDNDCDGAIDVSNPDNVVLIEFGSSMRYKANSADPSLGITWKETAFDDSSWTPGVYGVGYEVTAGGANDLIVTDVPTTTSSVYTRATFDIANVAAVNSMYAAGDWDDGYIVWINGVEVYRSPQMPGGDPDWDTMATGHESSNGATPSYGTLNDISTPALPALVNGTNVVAIGVWNDFGGGTSTDLVIVPRVSISLGPDDTDCLCADGDGDGYACTDCNDSDPSVNPAATEVCNDTIDNDCNGATADVVDQDGDTFTCVLDCDDNDAAVNPSATEIYCDQIDNDCNPGTPDVVDADSDFYGCDVDCDDNNASISPAAVEFCFDGLDNNCDGFIDASDDECTCPTPVDLDGDGYRCTDCNDGDPLVNPAANEICNDGKNNDCNPLTTDIFDNDQDGDTCDIDCNDADPSRFSGAIEICNDGIDNDCDGDVDNADVDCTGCPDVDMDGYPAGACGVDCDDSLPGVHPGAAEICNDGIDNDCDSGTLDVDDVDGDGFDCIADCDDTDASANPSAAEVCNDGVDNDCDGLIDVQSLDVALVQSGSSMRYIANSADPGIGIGWTVEAFDDTTWFNGLYGVGYQNGPPGQGGAENLIATFVPNTTLSVYTRTTFTINKAAGVTAMYASGDWDDGYVMWINGVEVYRSPEMPVGTPTWDANPALHESSNGLFPNYGTPIDISTPALGAIHDGQNVLAVGLYNNYPGMGVYSSDLVIVPRLSMDYGADDPDCFGCPDADGDGYAGGACAVDCNDANPDVNPGKTEIGCDLIDNDCDPGTSDVFDTDGDGSACNVDCNDSNADVYPGAPEIPCDFLDNDCDAFTPDVVDADSDTWNCTLDCDDSVAAINPGAAEILCDGIDNDCSTLTADIQDADGDGSFCDVDCNDSDPAVHPNAPEKCDDGIDNDCDLDTDGADVADCSCPDNDTDGYACLDCNDMDPAINPGMPEICNDSIDNDCNVATFDLDDADGDGVLCSLDCDDTDPFVRPGALEICNDGKDNDCDGGTPDIFDADADTYMCDVDCADGVASINPGATEVCNDGLDNDCNTGTLDIIDGDSDTFDCSLDCDDGDAAINPNAVEICNDGKDNDCNPLTLDLYDDDEDGTTCDLDCDDADPTRYIGQFEKCDDGVDNDCDGATDGADSECSCADGDGDGYRCTDCNDGDPNIHPNAVEICNDSMDNDCDPGTADFGDLDGDGYFCDVDCNDLDATVNPGMAELCNDGVDNDCNGGTPDLFDNDADTYTCDVDCNDSTPLAHPGLAEVGCDALDNDCNILTSDLADNDSDGYGCVDGTVRGGGISARTAGTGTVAIINNTIILNDMPFGIGGGIWIDDLSSSVPGSVSNNLVYLNTADVGGGIEHTTFFGSLTNNALFNNTGGDLYDGGGSGATKSGNMIVDPKLESLSAGNYRLREDSPLLEAADPGTSPANDYDRFPRPYDADGDMTALPDIGAFEYPSGEVFDLVFVNKTDLSWTVRPTDVAFNLYRGNRVQLVLNGTYTQTGPFAAQFCGILESSLPFTDTFVPATASQVLFYLVTTTSPSFEGTLGTDSKGALRPNDNSCQ